MTPGLVSAIVVNWNGARLLSTCLDALARQDYRPIETIVVDNGSRDGSEQIAAGRDGIRLIENGANLGFARGNNIGLAVADGEFVLLLNYDAVLERDYVSRLVAALRADPRRGSASGKLLRGDGRIDSTGHVIYRNVWAWNRAEDEPDTGAYDQPEEVFGVCAAAGLYRRAMLDDVAVAGEVLDQTFFAYLEDVDLDWRARLRGWCAWYEPGAVATHHRSASGGWYSTAIQRHIFKNRVLMLIKNDAGFARRLVGIIAFTLVQFVRGMIHSPAFVCAIGALAANVPAARRKRREIQARRTVSPRELEAWFQPYPYTRKLRRRQWGRTRRPWTSLS